MKKVRKLLGIALVLAIVLNALAIGASAVLGDGNQLSANLTLQVGKLSGTTFTPLTASDTLKANDVITVRICPQTDFLVGSSYYVAMFDKTYFKVVGANKAAFTANTANTFYDQTADGYAGSTNIPSTSWPASFGATENYNVYTAIKVGNLADSNSNNGGYPNLIPGDWLFQFKLTVQKDIPAGTNARIWMDSRWFRSPSNTTVDGYFAKCNDGDASSSGQSTIYNFMIDTSKADIKLPLGGAPVLSTITFDSAGGTAVAPISGNVGDPVTAPIAPTKTGYTFAGWSPALPATFPAGGLATTATWTANNYSITFDANGGTGGTIASVAYGATPTAPVVTKTGYTFAGWSPAIVPVTGDTTYQAQWSVNSYNITFDANGGTGGTIASVAYGAMPTAPVVTRTGYTFAGWSPAIVSVTGEATYQAQWTANQITITFNTDGGTAVAQLTGDYGSVVVAPPAPTKAGFTFDGWSPALPATFDTNITVVAQWKAVAPDTSTITFNSNGGTPVTQITGNVGDPVVAPADPTQAGYTFAGWSPALPATFPAGGLSVTATWTANKYNAVFKVDGNVYQTIAVSYGSAIPLPSDPMKTGNTFTGWSPVPATMGIGDEYFDATFTVNSYTAFFQVDGGSYKDVVTQYGAAIVLPSNPVKVGYTFVKWDSIPTTMPASNVIIGAVFSINSYNAIFNVDSQLYTTVPTVFNTQIQLPAAPTKAGYTFNGWSPVPGIIGAGDQTFNALWTANQITITFNSANGTAVAPAIGAFGSAVPAVTPPTRANYTFAGWSPAVPATFPATNLTCTATWTINQTTITFNTDGGTLIAPQTGDIGSAVTVPANPTKDGYSFAGWSPVLPSTFPASNLIVKALWVSNTVMGVVSVGFANPYFGGMAPITVKVNDRPAKIQFVSVANGMTNTYDRRTSTQIISIQGYDKDGKPVNTLSTALAYEIWVINVKLAAGDYTARAKYVNTWNAPKDDRPFTVTYAQKASVSINVNSPTIQRHMPAVFTIVTPSDVSKIQLRAADGTTRTYTSLTAIVAAHPAEGTLTWTVSITTSALGLFTQTLLTKTGTVWTDTGLSAGYTVV